MGSFPLNHDGISLANLTYEFSPLQLWFNACFSVDISPCCRGFAQAFPFSNKVPLGITIFTVLNPAYSPAVLIKATSQISLPIPASQSTLIFQTLTGYYWYSCYGTEMSYCV